MQDNVSSGRACEQKTEITTILRQSGDEMAKLIVIYELLPFTLFNFARTSSPAVLTKSAGRQQWQRGNSILYMQIVGTTTFAGHVLVQSWKLFVGLLIFGFDGIKKNWFDISHNFPNKWEIDKCIEDNDF